MYRTFPYCACPSTLLFIQIFREAVRTCSPLRAMVVEAAGAEPTSEKGAPRAAYTDTRLSANGNVRNTE